MKLQNRLFGTLFAVACSLSLLLSAMPAVSAAGTSNLTMTVSATKVNVGDTVTVTLTNREMDVISFVGGIAYDLDRFTCIKIAGDKEGKETDTPYLYDGEEWTKALAVSSLEDSAAAGTVGVAFAGTEEKHYKEHLFVTATFRAKSGGDAVFTLYESADGTDEFTSQKSDQKTVTVTGADVTKNDFALSKTVLTLKPGETAALSAEKTVTWSVDNETVATVDKNGKVTAVKEGTATVVATTEDGEKAYCAVTVKLADAADKTDDGIPTALLIAVPVLLVALAVGAFVFVKKKK